MTVANHDYPAIADEIELLTALISTDSYSRQNSATATIIENWLKVHGVKTRRHLNNVWAVSANYSSAKPTLMLNSHHDTVPPSASYTFPALEPFIRDGRLYGLGSNDAGGSLVSLCSVFAANHRRTDLPYNLLLAITDAEEYMGPEGMRAFLPHLSEQGFKPDMAIVGEPTSLQPAIAERGLLVLDCVAHGVAGHAARNEGVNALYAAVDDINVLRSLQFPKVSPTLGPVKISTTMIEAGTRHNVVPDVCKFVVDVRTTDAYTNEETVAMIADAVKSDVKPRSTHIRASVIDEAHPLVRAAVAVGGVPFVSPTTSDMALMPHFPTLKIGPGESSRSHTADEYIHLSELSDAISTYTNILNNISL